MRLIEHPCQIMDTEIRYQERINTEGEIWQEIQKIVDVVKQFHGELLLTWHIYIRNKQLIQDYITWCKKVIQYSVNEK